MTLNEYQKKARKTAIYPKSAGIPYCTLGLTSEAGEVAGKLKKSYRGDTPWSFCKEQMLSEMGDTLWYLAMLAEELKTTLEQIAELNLEKLAKRKQENKLKGEGDNR